MDRLFLRLGAVAGFLGVALGAFGAHALRASVTADRLAVFETAVRYQLIHALALVAVAIMLSRKPSTVTTAAGWCFLAGIALFSGSLYALVLTNTTTFGMVTPFGGLFFLAGWACLALAAL